MKAATFILTLLAAVGGAASKALSVPSTGTTPLRKEAAKKDIIIGSGAINPSFLDDPKFRAVLSKQFNSLSPENEMKWGFIHPSKDKYNWPLLDRLVDFAEGHNMLIKGHTLISSCCNPDYLLNMTDPIEFRAEMKNHIETIMHRYADKMNRWDVVTEGLETMGGGLQDNIYKKVLGASYIPDAFRFARAAAPKAKLFYNENLVESMPNKRQELLEYVTGLLADGVPIDGIGLQMHITELPLVPGIITEIVNSYIPLGLEVAITEMDVHTLNDTLQTEIYGATIAEALAAGITDISFWGFTDKHLYTWVPGAKPLMFDEEYRPKGSFYATHSALEKFVHQH
ncbi:related to endo-1,4-beta-xylanase [Fusarium oxysporum]|uniref:Beta-xylanase n=1 Tax=Fusarium oxysporum TaxID=5507 RepID=A0A2H3U462_FUSOX|nr:related to endo-1,4-beta-xylanase [Fusarium oxysporum]